MALKVTDFTKVEHDTSALAQLCDNMNNNILDLEIMPIQVTHTKMFYDLSLKSPAIPSQLAPCFQLQHALHSLHRDI